MFINIQALREEGFRVETAEDLNGDLSTIQIYPEKSLQLDWTPMHSQFEHLRVSTEIIENALEKFVETLHEEEVFDSMRRSKHHYTTESKEARRSKKVDF